MEALQHCSLLRCLLRPPAKHKTCRSSGGCFLIARVSRLGCYCQADVISKQSVRTCYSSSFPQTEDEAFSEQPALGVDRVLHFFSRSIGNDASNKQLEQRGFLPLATLSWVPSAFSQQGQGKNAISGMGMTPGYLPLKLPCHLSLEKGNSIPGILSFSESEKGADSTMSIYLLIWGLG